MSRTFAYGRVSTADQTTENQIQAIQQRGFAVEPHRWFEEQISGGVPALQRPEFSKMAERMEAGDVLVVLKLDRLGRDVQDVLKTIEHMQQRGIKVHSLDLDGVDLTSAAGKLQLTVLAAVAEFERSRIKERTREGLARTDKKGGRPVAVDTTKAVQECKGLGMTQAETVRKLGISLPTVKRHWNK